MRQLVALDNRTQNRIDERPLTLAPSLSQGGRILLYLLLDIFCILVSFYLSYWVRFDQTDLWAVNEGFESHLFIAMTMGIFLIALLYHKKLYTVERGVRDAHQDFTSVVSCVLWTLAFGVIASFIFHRFVISRIVLVIYALLLSLTLATWRWLDRKVMEYRCTQGYGQINVLIIGAGRTGQQLKNLLDERRWLGLRVVGFLDDRGSPASTNESAARIVGTLREFEKVVTLAHVQEVFITIPSEREKVLEIVAQANQLGVSVSVVPDLFNLLTREVEFKALGPFTVAKLFHPTLTEGQRILKRWEDICLAGALSLVFALPALLVVLLIKLDSRGPAIFKQTRLGEGGRPFTLYKFRSMYVDADETVHREHVTRLIRKTEAQPPGATSHIKKLTDDPRVTRVGRMIRKFNLDEVPQLWNVLKGDLSLVGPRPALLYEYAQFEEYYKKRLLIKPGITGLWQVSGRYELDYEQMLMLDVRYINEWSLGLDFRIILETIPHVVRGTGL
jgi:exopolysaccharide biosynthesis polyprenyl glycosylphosphotransferase